jgi:hypothetical protein
MRRNQRSFIRDKKRDRCVKKKSNVAVRIRIERKLKVKKNEKLLVGNLHG